ncbi:hypothetical protein LINGRAHAP2_LOCUS36410 [Linum grandiflorum]
MASIAVRLRSLPRLLLLMWRIWVFARVYLVGIKGWLIPTLQF